MFHFMRNRRWLILSFSGIIALAVLVAACGGFAGAGTSNGAAIPVAAPPQHVNQSGQSNGSNSSTSSAAGSTQQYLIKSFNINMQVKDTRQVASDLQAWISTTDPLSLVSNVNSQQVDQNLYSISMTFSVQASLFPRIESYLNSYPALHNGKLLNVTMNTQDVSGDYVDSQSRLKNLQAEQQRLLTLEGSAGALSDVLAIDQRLTDVEGQIEQIEAHLQDLKSQTTFYTVTVNLQPTPVVVTSPPSGAWNPGGIWQGAVAAVKVVAQVLATIFIWLLVFCVYIVPLAVIAWLVRRWWRARALKGTPKVTS
ncbi:MAG TPA: DUF4349 domain-containing protein [Ktedonobacteraceae bacterium]|nr:DUF4349 domain-containing protein [Ktedonobacteraceae bacterium]